MRYTLHSTRFTMNVSHVRTKPSKHIKLHILMLNLHLLSAYSAYSHDFPMIFPKKKPVDFPQLNTDVKTPTFNAQVSPKASWATSSAGAPWALMHLGPWPWRPVFFRVFYTMGKTMGKKHGKTPGKNPGQICKGPPIRYNMNIGQKKRLVDTKQGDLMEFHGILRMFNMMMGWWGSHWLSNC